MSHVSISNIIYCCGGANGPNNTNSCERLDIREGKWKLITNHKIGLYGATSEYCSDYSFLCCGGSRQGSLSVKSSYIYETRKNEWRQVDDTPQVRTCSASFTKNNKIFLCGGKFDTSSIDCFDIDTEKWNVIPFKNHVDIWHHSMTKVSLVNF
eukprot:c37062_g1_i1.p1 GENE.c37062_g1_i1~~c37062_g1_i1.p1  ORF type:complete len:153 (+),score=47.88 c37062_g1_i1:92-550(+)